MSTNKQILTKIPKRLRPNIIREIENLTEWFGIVAANHFHGNQHGQFDEKDQPKVLRILSKDKGHDKIVEYAYNTARRSIVTECEV